MIDILYKLRPLSFLKCNRFTSNDMHQWPALNSWHDHAVDKLRPSAQCISFSIHNATIIFRISAHQDHTASRTSQGLMSRSRNKMSIRNGAGVSASGHYAGNMSHIDHKVSPDLICNSPKGVKIDDARIGTSAGNYQLRLMLTSKKGHLIEVYKLSIRIYAIVHHLVELTRE